MFADIAQEVERSIGSAEVTGPTPVISLTKAHRTISFVGFFITKILKKMHFDIYYRLPLGKIQLNFFIYKLII